MTTVAWRAGWVAADRLVDEWMDSGKLFRLKDGSVLTGAGYLDDIVEVAAWIGAGCRQDAKPDGLSADKDDRTGFLLACPDGKAYWLTQPWLRRVEITDEFFALGSGAPYALAAMAMGAGAKRAVQVAMRFDPNTGRGVDAIRVKRP